MPLLSSFFWSRSRDDVVTFGAVLSRAARRGPRAPGGRRTMTLPEGSGKPVSAPILKGAGPASAWGRFCRAHCLAGAGAPPRCRRPCHGVHQRGTLTSGLARAARIPGRRKLRRGFLHRCGARRGGLVGGPHVERSQETTRKLGPSLDGSGFLALAGTRRRWRAAIGSTTSRDVSACPEWTNVGPPRANPMSREAGFAP